MKKCCIFHYLCWIALSIVIDPSCAKLNTRKDYRFGIGGNMGFRLTGIKFHTGYIMLFNTAESFIEKRLCLVGKKNLSKNME